MFYVGLGINEDTVIKYFKAAKNSDIGKRDRLTIREYLDGAIGQKLSLWQYRIQDPFLRIVTIPTLVKFTVEFEYTPALGCITDIDILPQDHIDAIIADNAEAEDIRNSGYQYIVGFLSNFYTDTKVLKMSDKLIKKGLL